MTKQKLNPKTDEHRPTWQDFARDMLLLVALAVLLRVISLWAIDSGRLLAYGLGLIVICAGINRIWKIFVRLRKWSGTN